MQEKGEKRINESDRQLILNVLNYDMTDIFESMGYNTRGGEFVYVEPKETNITVIADVITKMRNAGTPVSDDTFYELTGIPKPENYDQLKAEQQEKRNAVVPDKKDTPDSKTAQRKEEKRKDLNDSQTESKNYLTRFYNHIRRFFVRAPKSGALRW